MKLLHLYLFLLALLVSCAEPVKIKPSEDMDLLAIDALMSQQSKVLIGKNCLKTAIINDKREQQTFPIDSTFFKTDLSIVRDDLSGIFGQLLYQKETSNNDKSVSYTRTDQAYNGPLSMRIEKDARGAITQIEITEEKKNYLHHTTLKIQLVFDDSNALLKSYQIEGTQQIIGMDAIPFKIEGLIN